MNGKNFKKNIPQPILIVLMVLLSNVIFYLLFFPSENAPEKTIPEDFIEIKLEAKLQTPFQKGKKVLLQHPRSAQMFEALLISEHEDGLITVATNEKSGGALLREGSWRILPLIKMNITQAKGENREIRY